MKTTTKPKNTLRLAGAWLCSKATTVCIGTASLLLLSNSSAPGGSVTWTFDTDPTLPTDAHPIKVFQGQADAFKDSGSNSVYFKATGGNPGGFLGVCWPVGSSSTIVLFPDIDNKGLVTSFKLDTDLRIGNPQQTDRAADGFSINFARNNDPVFTVDPPTVDQMAAPGQPENGTSTGLAVSFDTWSGNQLPGGEADIEGIIVRVDNVTVLKQAMPTRNGTCTDITSMQTGNKNSAYWTAVRTNGFNQDYTLTDLTATPPISPDAAFAPDSWTNLCWAHLSVELDLSSKLTVMYKGATLLDHFQTTFFPSAGGIVLAGRTGGADEHTHFDNMTLVTTASAADTVAPTVPGALAATSTGSSRVALTWNASTDASGRVAYEVSRDDFILAGTLTTTNFVDTPPLGNHAYTYKVVAFDVSGNRSAAATLPVTTAADTTVVGTVRAQIYDGISGVTIVDLLGSDKWNAKTPNRTRYGMGGTFGNPSGTGGWNESFGDNYGLFATGTLTVPETGAYTFFIRSDDSSQFFLHTDATIPDPAFDPPIVVENQCCHEFQEPTSDINLGLVSGSDGGMTSTNPITLTKGTYYGFAVLLKEGGGGDGVGVAMRVAGDTTPAANVAPISGLFVQGQADPLGSSLTILQQPTNTTVIANEATSLSVGSTNFCEYGTAKWYQWLKDGNPVRNAVGSTLAFPVVALTDQGQYAVVVGTEGLVQTSAVATLTVTADTKKPTIVSAAQADGTFKTIKVTFSEPVTAPTASTAGNYTLDHGATVSAAALSANGFSVTLTTSALNADATVYTLTVNNVADNAANAIAASSTVQFTSLIKVLVNDPQIAFFGGINGTAVNLLTADPRYPATPDQTFAATNGLSIGSPNGNNGWNESFGDNYGMRITGVLTPPGTGQYNFFIRSDDSSQFFLNTTGATLPDTSGTPTAAEPGCCNAFQEPGSAAQTTKTPISLTAGQQYGYVVLLKEGGGGDGVAVALRGVGDTTAAGNLAPIASAMPKFVAPPTGLKLTVSQSAGSVTITWGGAGTLQVAPALGGPPTSWTDLPGAANPYLTPASASAAYYRVKQ